MAQRSAAQITSNEGDIQLAISSIKSGQLKHNRRAADTYNVAESTLRGRRAGVPARRDCQPNSKKLTQREEEVIVKYLILTRVDLRLRTQLYVIWLINCWLRATLVRSASTGRATLSSVQTLSRRVSIARTIGRELYVKTQRLSRADLSWWSRQRRRTASVMMTSITLTRLAL